MGFLSDALGGLFNLFSFSDSQSYSQQVANANLTQTYFGSCQFNCDNTINDVSVIVNNSHINDINMTNACFVDANCILSTSVSAISDVLFAAKNGSTATDPNNTVFNGVSVNISDSSSYQDINQAVNTNIIAKCGGVSYDNISNVLVFINNSDAHDVNIANMGTATGSCSLNTAMSAQTQASATSDNTSSAGGGGKDKGKGSSIIGYIVVPIVLLAGIYMVMRMLQHPAQAGTSAQAGTPAQAGTSANAQPKPQVPMSQPMQGFASRILAH